MEIGIIGCFYYIYIFSRNASEFMIFVTEKTEIYEI